ncbi:MAG: hypothetical protein MK081_01580 [Flavobacteriales bacterium]|nr:hypothetical protein [Flavobacteriales bacterium]
MKNLFFICPTDGLEMAIHNQSSAKNYFLSSLGNALVFDQKAMIDIVDFIIAKDIETVNCVLSTTNYIVAEMFEIGTVNPMDLQSKSDQNRKTRGKGKVICLANDLSHSLVGLYLRKQLETLNAIIRSEHQVNLNIQGYIFDSYTNKFIDLRPSGNVVERSTLN